MKVVITGGCGFLGLAIARALGLPKDESLDRIIEDFIEDWL